MNKFELFIGYLGNGATVCNKAVYENGDFKQIAHISPAGNIKFYIAPETIPAEAINIIEKVANNHRNKTISELNLLLDESQKDIEYITNYYHVLDKISRYTHWKDCDDLMESLKNKTCAEKNDLIKEYYLTHF